MEGNQINNTGMDLDLNQEPTDDPFGSSLGLGSLLNELEPTHVTIEDRIRHLEAVTARARHRQRWRQLRNSFETSTDFIEPLLRNVDLNREEGSTGGGGNGAERNRGCKRDSSHLVAKKTQEKDNFFDCNICLNIAKEPILTCCGHLFCWICYYKLPYSYSTTKECPVCKGEVTNLTLVPIYGNGGNTKESKMDSTIPPRPKGHRIQSLRQQQSMSRILVTELGSFRTSLGIYLTPEQEQEAAAAAENAESFPIVGNSSLRLRRRLRGHIGRVLTDSAASLSSISSALNSAERLVEDLDMYINNNRISSVDGDLSTVPVVASSSSRTINTPVEESSQFRSLGQSNLQGEGL